ncbi:MAG: ribosome biogenesis GTPase Der [Sulfurimonas sp. RIFOXYD12_FULL_33_39]|uniref:ribosome biogenesis GTPase Der n=1 Tax=unclassified Sulfurimonas TaxID=2623549 RepID=UPI0008ADCEC4|nr:MULTISPECIES: ribosome biogenesis GTPase Der [unclassified Sulfurimonas]OHE02305.1 MAG: ribosome biogenesis GTPase Der [Sulfurimonas sp. RIFCSPLOWO2_12_FULL_34_6]OHE10478.1 MAG: ribosome biogenesis GTPase Der [Sulfurimonas sp. RIFOXYD12_FULL_33_39]OHE14937.1 MAG: ribosome biogenesis GTPase Der [Sulfurimonas sp. RIFOXYD2_FULL_34_21]DAB28227.1 MAG TPA: ribosome biogenesis GTPase Der [Sulfurimonas sp. UBA10385]
MKKIAIIGRPNVGKSSLFNRLVKKRDAITSEQAGTTRDVKRRHVVIINKEALLLDTGGLDKGCELFDRIKEKSLEAAHKADIILYMVDGRTIPEDEDKKLFYELQTLGKDVALVVNKIDNDKMKDNLWDYYEFGTDAIFGISVAHNRSIVPLLDWMYEKIPDSDIIKEENDEEDDVNIIEEDGSEYDFFDEDENAEDEDEDDDDGFFYTDVNEEDFEDDSIFAQNDRIKEFNEEDVNHIKISIIGRTNVGKSSLLNALLGEERSVVSSVAGTTIDPIDESIEYKGKQLTFVDTAGLRRRGKIVGIEKFALMRTKEMLENSNMALVVLDASEPLLDLDEKIAGLVDSNRLACIIVLNKWDIANREDYDKIIQNVRDRFKFLAYAPIITLSAKSHKRVDKLHDMILEINENYSQRIKTSELNEVLEKALRRHQLPSMRGQVIRIYYATQYETRPPKIAIVMNKPRGLHFTYRRYLTNKLRESFNFSGTPVLFKAKKRGEK